MEIIIFFFFQITFINLSIKAVILRRSLGQVQDVMWSLCVPTQTYGSRRLSRRWSVQAIVVPSALHFLACVRVCLFGRRRGLDRRHWLISGALRDALTSCQAKKALMSSAEDNSALPVD